jgi:hypothetical protein
MSANMKGAADPPMDDTAVGAGTAPGDMNLKSIPAASAPTLYISI